MVRTEKEEHGVMSIKNGFLASAAIGSLIVAVPSAALSQDDEADDNREVIVVTARNREENLQDVPLAITAFDEEAIKTRGIQDLDDVARFTAGFAFEDFDGGNASPVIRGQSTARLTAREQTVATFLDGIYLPRSWLVDLGTSNLERIEIVKGPQSARYGRNAFAGAINYITKKAGDEFEADVTVTFGNHERVDIGGSFTVPVIPGVLAIRGSYDDTEFDGSWENDHPNANAGISPGTNGNVGGYDNRSWSANVLFTPVDRISIDASYYGFRKEEEARATRYLNSGFGETNCGSLTGTPAQLRLLCGEFPAPGDTVTVEPRGFGRQAEADIVRAEVSFDITDAITASYLFGYIEAETVTANTAENDTVTCLSIIPGRCNFQASPLGFLDYTSHEARLTYDNDGPFSGAIGAFVLNGIDQNFFISINPPAGLTDPFRITPDSGVGFLVRNEETDTDVKSVFVELNYSFADDRARIGAEARYTSETIFTENIRTPALTQPEEEFTFFTPRITFEYDLTDDSLLFASVARGAKAGGFNSGATGEFGTFDPEFNWTYELGAKNLFLDGRLIANAAVFLTNWKNQQINSADPSAADPLATSITRNLGNATIWGLELEGSFQASENLSFDAAISYNNPTYDDGTIDQVYARFGPISPFFGLQTSASPCDDVVCSSNGDVSGNDLERAPNTQIAFGAQWEDYILGDTRYYIRGDLGYQSSFFSDSVNLVTVPSRTVFNASAGLDIGEHVELSIWARNLTDERYISNSLAIIQQDFSNIFGSYFGERRTFGATIKLQY